jgi:hypothetical protein
VFSGVVWCAVVLGGIRLHASVHRLVGTVLSKQHALGIHYRQAFPASKLQRAQLQTYVCWILNPDLLSNNGGAVLCCAQVAPLLQCVGCVQLEQWSVKGEERALGGLLGLVADQVRARAHMYTCCLCQAGASLVQICCSAFVLCTAVFARIWYIALHVHGGWLAHRACAASLC